MSIKFCHIAPTAHLSEYTKTNGAHLILAHLVETDREYADFYANLPEGATKIMDNSAFEMYKQGRPMYPSEKLLDMAYKCGATHIVLSDYPGEPGQKTIDAAEASIDEIRKEGFEAFFVPQSQIGDLEDYLRTIEWALGNEKIDLIGLSILGAPNAFGVEKNNKLQRYLSRKHILDILKSRGSLIDAWGRFHCLGMVDGPNEIQLLKEYKDYIYSWDSSAAVWAGLNGISFDGSPTGMVNGKFEKEVDFGIKFDTTTEFFQEKIDPVVRRNINYIDRLCR